VALYSFVKQRLGNGPMVSMGSLSVKKTYMRKNSEHTNEFINTYPWVSNVYDIDDITKQYKLVG
jgi:hypothetical protein